MDAARMAAQSDPDLNYHFRRRWSAPPLKQIRPRIAGTIQGAQDCLGISSNSEDSEIARLFQWADRLERVADPELAFGRFAAAARLTLQAEIIRECAL